MNVANFPLLHIDTRERERPHPTRQNQSSGVNMLKLFLDHPLYKNSPDKVTSTELYAGDFAFTGHGPQGPAQIGIERKRVRGLMGDIRTGRVSGIQLPKLFDPEKGYDFIYMIVEGRARTNYYTGVLEEKQGRNWVPIQYGNNVYLGLELDSFVNSISRLLPIVVLRTRDEKETFTAIMSLLHTFSKPWEKHHAHIAIHRPQEYATVGKASLVRRVAFDIDGIGWEKSGTIEQNFPSVHAMCNALPGTFAGLPGIGKVLSQSIYDQLHGVHKPK